MSSGPSAFQIQCENGYFGNGVVDNRALAEKCAKERTNQSPETPFIAILAEKRMFFPDAYRVVEGGPIVKMWHILDGLAAKNDLRVGVYVKRHSNNSVYVINPKSVDGGATEITSLRFERSSGRGAYYQYLAAVRKDSTPFYVGNFWWDNELHCFPFLVYGLREDGRGRYGHESDVVIAAMRAFGACANVDLPEEIAYASWDKALKWVVSEEGLPKFVRDRNQPQQ